MAALEQLAIHIYHERQEHGSALCAQHALNSLLQGNYFTPTDLSTIAQSLDTLEQHVDQGRLGRASTNMDDTGFFSIQVLENALNVWGQSLIRWRSESMQPYHDQPQNQRAFILNCDQHWFTLRRFGNSEDAGPWFNLDSSLDRPEWVSDTYLGILLQQAEADGYSTFVVVPIDPDHPLPQSDADVIAADLPRLAPSRAQYSSTVRSPRSSAVLEDEDLQLQAVLHASLDGRTGRFPMPPPHVGPVAGGVNPQSSRATTSFPSPFLPVPPPPVPPPTTRPAGQPMENPVAASMARNQAMLERMRREQEAALREHYHEEALSFDDPRSVPYHGAGTHDPVEDEEEQIRRAIAQSEEMAREQGDAQTGGDTAENTQTGRWTQEHVHGGRVYDDEDAELQAALQASLETAPPAPDPDTTTPPRASRTRRSPLMTRTMAGTHANPSTGADEEDSDELYSGDDEDDTATEDTLSGTDAPPPPPAEDVDIEEMRRRRLARFGGP